RDNDVEASGCETLLRRRPGDIEDAEPHEALTASGRQTLGIDDERAADIRERVLDRSPLERRQQRLRQQSPSTTDLQSARRPAARALGEGGEQLAYELLTERDVGVVADRFDGPPEPLDVVLAEEEANRRNLARQRKVKVRGAMVEQLEQRRHLGIVR